MRVYVYFDVQWAIKEHEDVMARSGGGREGILKPQELPGVFGFMQDDGFYPEFEDKLTYLVFSIIKNHYFADGNKRSSIAIGAYFLKVNGYNEIIPYFMEVMEDIVLCVADNLIEKEELKNFLIDILFTGTLSNGSKLILIKALTEYKLKYPQYYKTS